MSIVSTAWEIPMVGSPNYVWERKLKNTKATLKTWVKLSNKNPICERKESLVSGEIGGGAIGNGRIRNLPCSVGKRAKSSIQFLLSI